jgi:release factor glutamine methyltransferase
MKDELGRTVGEAMAWGRKTLSNVSNHAARDASLLLAHVLKENPESPYLHPEAPLDSNTALTYFDFIQRRARGEPVAYIRGFQEFMGLKFAVDKRVLIPRPETEILVEEILAFLRRGRVGERANGHSDDSPNTGLRFGGDSPAIADIGCGSGAIGLSVARNCPGATVILTDTSREALQVARDNAVSLGLLEGGPGRPSSRDGLWERVSFLQGNLLEPLVLGKVRNLDVVASNPPYIAAEEMHSLPQEVRREPRLALDGGEGGLLYITQLIAGSGPFLRPGGMLIFEVDDGQASAVTEMLKGSGWEDPKILPDLAGYNRVARGFKPEA